MSSKSFFQRYYLPLLIVILLFAFISRIYRLNLPDRYIFDEVYHAITAKLIARNDVRAFEWWNPPVEEDTAVDWLHPPLAKYTQAFFIILFGENAFGWRVSSALFGVLVIAATATLSQELFRNHQLSLMAAFLASLDGLLLVQSRIAMNDIHVTFFILLTLICYLRYRRSTTDHQRNWGLLLTGIAAGLAMGSKWSGLFVLLIIWISELVSIRQINLKTAIEWLKKVVIIGLLPFGLYILSYWLMFLQGKSFVCREQASIQSQCYYEEFRWKGQLIYKGYISHFVELHRQIWWYQTNLKATHGYQSRPVQWFFDLRPVWFHVDYSDEGKIGNIYAFGNPALFWLGDAAVIFTIVTLVVMSGSYLKRKKIVMIPRWFTLKRQVPTKRLGFLLLSYLMVWLPWQLSPRIMFFYHYTPAVPLLSIILAWWLQDLSQWQWQKKKLGAVLTTCAIVVIATCFVLWYPHWTGIPVPKDFAQHLYFALLQWK